MHIKVQSDVSTLSRPETRQSAEARVKTLIHDGQVVSVRTVQAPKKVGGK